MVSPMRILFLSSEAEPFVKVGGLGDVAGSLPKALREQGIDIRLTIPLHGTIQRSAYDLTLLATFEIPHSSGPIPAEVFTTDLDGLPVYLISGPPFSPEEAVYSNNWGYDAHKYIFFSLAAMELARAINWQPHIIHANDWHTSPAVYWLALNRPLDPFFKQTASLLTVHNLPYLGADGSDPLEAFNLPAANKSLLPIWAQHLPLPLGLLTADYIVAVSPTYAREILKHEFGSGLDEFLSTRVNAITGILNGLDQEQWDPSKDTNLVVPFNMETLFQRQANKIALKQEWDLPSDPSIPLLGFIGRLNHQKGIDLAVDALLSLVDLPWQAIFLGTGVREFEDIIRQLQDEYPERVRAVIRFDAALSHRIYAGADALLVPSRYEPCGLVQMIAMRYGCVPIARATGGLKDTVIEDGNQANGFLFIEARPENLTHAIRRACSSYTHPARWQALQRHGMQMDFSWTKSAREYSRLYQKLMKER
jgi:starch synthase